MSDPRVRDIVRELRRLDSATLAEVARELRAIRGLPFLIEAEEMCRAHGLSIAHEDDHGAFLVVPFDEAWMSVLREARAWPSPTFNGLNPLERAAADATLCGEPHEGYLPNYEHWTCFACQREFRASRHIYREQASRCEPCYRDYVNSMPGHGAG